MNSKASSNNVELGNVLADPLAIGMNNIKMHLEEVSLEGFE